MGKILGHVKTAIATANSSYSQEVRLGAVCHELKTAVLDLNMALLAIKKEKAISLARAAQFTLAI
jgi:hypothetical protein